MFYREVKNGLITEVDFLHHSLSNFKKKYPVSYYRVDESDKNRPDLISYRCYGSVKYWWLILAANSISNPFELEVGKVLEIPNILDIYEFYKQYAR